MGWLDPPSFLPAEISERARYREVVRVGDEKFLDRFGVVSGHVLQQQRGKGENRSRRQGDAGEGAAGAKLTIDFFIRFLLGGGPAAFPSWC